jgi:hypothetical protein
VKKWKKKKREKYLTVHVRPSDQLRSTIVVSIPRDYYFAEAIPDVVRIAIEHAQRMDARVKQ